MAVRNDFTAGEVLAAADLNDTFASKVDYATPTNAQSGTAYTFVADDAERITTASNGSAVTFTIPPQSSVGWVDDTILRVVNYGAGALTVAGGSGVTVTNTATVINQYGGGAAIRTGSDAWTFVPFGAGEAFEATGGNEVGTVGSFRYHIFTSSSSFVVDSGTKECGILVVGGGAGGGRNAGGGGGGGAIEPASGFSAQTLSAGSYTVTVGAGGSGSTADANKGGTGGNSSFAGTSTITANGGGGGGSASNTGGGSGGSGGGGFQSGSGGTASGSNTNAGAAGTGSAGGGGGGATAAGSSANGGAGFTLTSIDSNLTSGNFTSFTGMTVISSGGGGGSGSSAGTGGTGAGNGGQGNGVAGAAAVSYGSGGGGGGTGQTAGGNGGNGKAGIVIVRYAV